QLIAWRSLAGRICPAGEICDGLLEEVATVADDVARRIIYIRRTRIVGWLIREAGSADKTLVRDYGSAGDGRIYGHVERDRCDVSWVVRRVGRHRTWRAARRIDLHAVDESRHTGDIRNRSVIQFRAAGNIGRVRWDCVAQDHVRRIG